MRIGLVVPRSTFLESKMHIPSLGVGYLGARLESLGHSVDLFDLNEDELPKDGEYQQLWVSSTAPQRAEVVRIAKETQGWKTKRVLGGAAVWTHPDAYRELGYDMIFGGECDAEESVREILELAEHPNEEHYKFFPTSPTLDWVLPPIRRWNDRYHAHMTDVDGNTYRMTTMFGTRGCPMSCQFCDSGRAGKVWDRFTRYEPLELIERQMAESAAQGFTGLMWYDDIMVLNRQRTLSIMELHRKYNLAWRGFMRSDILVKYGKEFFRELREGHLIELFCGIESADNRIKANIHKGTTIEEDTQVLEWGKEMGVHMKASFILGLPGESRESMERTREWIFKNRPYRVQCGRLIPLAGTPIAEHPELFDLTYEEQPDDEWYYSGNNGEGTRSFVSTSHLTRDEIDAYWHSLMQDLKTAGIPS